MSKLDHVALNHHAPGLSNVVAYCFQQWHTLGYVLVALGIFLEGDAVLYTAGFLTHRGVLSIGLGFLWVLAGATIGDILWYKLGEYLEPKDNRIVRWLKKMTNPLGPHLLERPRRSLFISKFLYGVNHAILCKAGALHIPLKDFARMDLPANIAWIVIVGGIGYASSAGFTHLKHYLHYGELALLLGIVGFLLLSRLFTYFFKRKL